MTDEKKWFERDGVIFFSVTSNGRTAKEWLLRFGMGHNLWAQIVGEESLEAQILLSGLFQATNGVTYDIEVWRHEKFCGGNESFQPILKFGIEHGLCRIVPGIELACLIREKFSDDEIAEMGLESIVLMHRPYHQDHRLLLRTTQVSKHAVRKNSLATVKDSALEDKVKWGFAFVTWSGIIT